MIALGAGGKSLRKNLQCTLESSFRHRRLKLLRKILKVLRMSVRSVLSSVLVLIACWQSCHATDTGQVNVQYDTPDDTDQYHAQWPQASTTTSANSVETETEGASLSHIRATGFSENIFSSEEIFTSDDDGSLPAHNKPRESTQAERMRRQAANATHPKMLNDETDPELKKKPIKGSAMTSTQQSTAASEQMSMIQVLEEMMKLKDESVELRTRVALLEKNADSNLTNVEAKLLEKSTELQRENKALREELLKISDNISGNMTEFLNDGQAFRAEMLTISNNMSGNMMKLSNDHKTLRTTVSSLNTTAGEMNSQLHKLSEMTSNLQKQKPPFTPS